MHEKSVSQLLLEISDASTGKLDKETSLLSDELSGRRELVNLLDAEPLLDYLVQNGVLDGVEKEEVLKEEENTKQNLLLLKLVETRPNGVKLFTNVMRQTGQHYLANLVDDGIRIKALSGSGYLSKSRHKGQVELKIRVKSMKLQQPIFKTVSELLHKDWISLEDIQTRLSSIKKFQSQSQRSSMVDRIPSQRCSYTEPAAAAQPAAMETDEDSEERGCCFCCCCCCAPRKSKSSKKAVAPEPNDLGEPVLTADNSNVNATPVGDVAVVGPGNVIVTCQPQRKLSACQDIRLTYIRNGNGSLKQKRDDSVENLRNVANNIQEKCLDLYAALSDTSAPVHVNLLRYLEQERGILSLSTNSGDFLEILCICTKPDHITQLQADNLSGRLTAELERILTAPEVLQPLGILGVKLEIEVNEDDLEVAGQELA